MTMKMTTFWFDPQMKTTLRVAAARKGVGMGELIREAISEYIERNPSLFFDVYAQQATQSDQQATQQLEQS